MVVEMGANRYGKGAVRLLRMVRGDGSHHFADITVDIRLEGDFAAAYTGGDNRAVLPTDTMKNTVYAMARTLEPSDPETFASALARRFLAATPAASAAHVEIRQRPWRNIKVDGRRHPHAFTTSAEERRVARVRADRNGVAIGAGLEGLTVLKTTGSGFEDYLVDEYTTLPPAADRILATVITATWDYSDTLSDYDSTFASVRDILMGGFADHPSLSVQDSLYAMGKAVIERRPEVAEISMTMPNKHHLWVDLAPFGLDNPDLVYLPVDEPHGVIEGTIRRA